MARAVLLLLLVVALAYSSAFPQELGVSQECGPNEVFKACGTPCEQRCGQEQPPICVMRCAIGCQCEPGYVRNADNQCVLTREC